MASMKEENTKPVGRLSVPFTFIKEGTHINTGEELKETYIFARKAERKMSKLIGN